MMAGVEDEATILGRIQETYVPFLKKLIAFLEKTKKATPENLNRLKSIYTIFTTGSVAEQIETFNVNEKKLEKWYKNSQKEKNAEEGVPRKGKRSLTASDTDSSQGAFENAALPSKRSTFKNAIKASESSKESDSSKLSSSSVNSKDSNQGATVPSPIPTIPLSQIKKEKMDDAPKVAQPAKKATPVNASSASNESSAPAKQTVDLTKADGPITFTCASCQFQTLDETEFMKHARTDHRTDLSMWCKQCGKCFSNAGVLVSHIKEQSCVKEEMIYRCGVKECTFETTSGQTFVHHLRHCHKGSPFIFCCHCQKIFTLPHCLILHMQDDCPFKDRNRRAPGSAAPVEASPASTNAAPVTPKPTFTPPVQPPIQPRVTAPAFTPVATVPSPRPRLIAPAPTPIIAASSSSLTVPVLRGKTPIAGRGRGRGGRGRGRSRAASESSDSDDPDDPSWHPEESLTSQTLRRSGRWAKKVSDVINVEPSLTGEPKPAPKKNISLAELNSNEMLNCPCCDFMAVFKTVLEDHYIAHHKHATRNVCTVCRLKFESTRLFLDHFAEHASGKLSNHQPVEEQEQESTTEKAVTATHSTEANLSQNSVSSESTLLDNETFNGVVENISDANVVDPTSDKSKFVKIPYQSAIHEKNLKEARIKKFEGLKSPNDLVSMKNEGKLKHFFKCVLYNCTYTTDESATYRSHLDTVHSGKRLHCAYCLKEFFSSEALTNHLLQEHSKRQYQCSSCFYRAYSKIHVQIHIKNLHAKETAEVYTCQLIEIPSDLKLLDNVEVLDTSWPYICAIGACNFQSFDPKEFKKHNERVHRSVSVYFCHYCKVDFISFKRLMNHYRLHGINTFQCSYCIHGSETKDEILLHLCNVHADHPLKAYMRGSQEDASSEAMQLVRSEGNITEISEDKTSEKLLEDGTVKEKAYTGCEKELYHIHNDIYYPKHLKSICTDFFCGVPFCDEKFENMLQYVGHLRHAHAAVNFACPHCPEMLQNWDSFKNHLLCHGPDLYGCHVTECQFYSWHAKDVTKHVEDNHKNESTKILTIRESSSNEESSEISKINSLPRECPFDTANECHECLFCKYKSNDKKIMKNHFYSEMAYKRFYCRYCNNKILSRKEVEKHFSTLHAESEVSCLNRCNPEIESCVRKILAQKMVFPIPDSESCFICCKKFKSFHQWQSHSLLCISREYHPYECVHCKDSFSNLKAYKYHNDEKHFSEKLQYVVVSNYAIEEDISKRLLQLRLKYLKDTIRDALQNEDNESISQKSKFYACSLCSFEADFKQIVEKHVTDSHEDKEAVVNKSFKENSVETSNNLSDDNSNDSLCISLEKHKVKRYRCGFCIKKMFTIQELEKHVEGHHPVKNEFEYFFYYSPDPKAEYPPDDKEVYECAYCKSCKENLFALKKHASLMHGEMHFKVKGYVVRNKSQASYLACGHCYMKMENSVELKRHTASYHSSLPEKSIGECVGNGVKRPREETDEFGHKRVKFGNSVYVCTHCGAAFSNLGQISIHSKAAHSRLQLEYKVMQASDSANLDDVNFYKCEFCAFIGEKQYLDKHLTSKHKARVSCFYCKKRFEFATKLKEHHDVHHKGLPVKYSQETISVKTEHQSPASSGNSAATPKATSNNSVFQLSIPENVSHYGKSPQPLDFSKLSVWVTNEGQYRKMPLKSFSQMFNVFPKVVLKDIKKE